MAKFLKDAEQLWSIEAEYAVLGSMAIDSACIPEVAAVITATEMFYSEPTRLLFDAILALHVQDQPIDAVMIRTQLKRKRKFEDAGGIDTITHLMDSVPSAASAVYYAKIVREKYRFRLMLQVVQEIGDIPDEPGDCNEQITRIQSLALGLEIEREREAHTFKADVLESVVSLGDKRHCLPIGFTDVDKIIHGLYQHEFAVIAGRPGHGKSCFCGDVAVNVASQGKRVIFFSLEMSAESIMQRTVCATASVNAHNWEGTPPQEEFDSAFEAGQALSRLDITVYETVETAKQMHAIVSAAQRLSSVDLVCIDNIQLMQTEQPTHKEYERLTSISRQLKKISQTLHTPILCISHLNREVEKRNNHRPKLSDLRGSGGMEQDADLVLFLHREDQYRVLEDPDNAKRDGIAELVVAKNRRGKTGIAKLLFREQFTTFVNMVPEYLQEQGA